MNLFFHLGRYFILIKRVFSKPEKSSVYFKRIVSEIDNIGISSLPIIAIISFFMGGVITIQSAFGFTSPLVPLYAVGFAARESMLLEFSPTIVCLILAGKIGSNIASEIGTMRITEQIDALEIMGINSSGYLILPKIAAGMLIMPFLIAISMFLGIFGGYLAAVFGGFATETEFINGLQVEFIPFHITYAFIKTLAFAFILATIPSFHGYYMKGGALEVGKASTISFVWTSVVIIIVNYLLTQILLS